MQVVIHRTPGDTESQPGYRLGLDRDHDGTACE